jgi:hypothetical protein
MKTKTMHKFTLTNSFHGTSTSVLCDYRDGEVSQIQVYSDLVDAASREYRFGPARRRLNRVRNALCGFSGCTCGTVRP